MGIEGNSSNNEVQSQEIQQANSEQIEQNHAEHQRSGEQLEANPTIDNEGERKQIEGKEDATDRDTKEDQGGQEDKNRLDDNSSIDSPEQKADHNVTEQQTDSAARQSLESIGAGNEPQEQEEKTDKSSESESSKSEVSTEQQRPDTEAPNIEAPNTEAQQQVESKEDGTKQSAPEAEQKADVEKPDETEKADAEKPVEIEKADAEKPAEAEKIETEKPDEMKETLKSFEQENWDKFSEQEKYEAISDFKNEVAKDLDIKNVPDVDFYHDDDKNNYGYFDSEANKIYINADNIADSKETADTVAHEMRHCYQYEVSENPQTPEEQEFRDNFDHYITPEFNYEQYENQPIEKDAANYAASIVDHIGADEEKQSESDNSNRSLDTKGYAENYSDQNQMKGSVFDQKDDSKFKLFGEGGLISGWVDRIKNVFSSNKEEQFKTFTDMNKANKWAFNSYKDWTNKLSDRDILAVYDYTGEKHCYNMNAVLRGLSDKYELNNEQLVDNLTEALNKAEVPENVNLFRGTSMAALGDLQHVDPQDMIGHTIVDNGFFSASFDINTAKDEQFQKGLLLDIDVPKGTCGAYVAHISQYGGESELLLNRGQSMIIKGADTSNPAYLKLKVEIINDRD